MEKSKWQLVLSHPNIFCFEHFLRIRKIRKSLIYTDVVCRGQSEICCGDKLSKNIKKVVGLLGGKRKGWWVESDIGYVNLKCEEENLYHNADIDALEICSDNFDLNYHLAINAVILALRNDLAKSEDYLKGVYAVVNNHYNLSRGDTKLLAKFFREVSLVENTNSQDS